MSTTTSTAIPPPVVIPLSKAAARLITVTLSAPAERLLTPSTRPSDRETAAVR